MPDYNLGTAHGQIKVDYDDRGSRRAKKDFSSIGDHTIGLVNRFRRLHRSIGETREHFGEMGSSIARTTGVLAGTAAILLGMSRATGVLSGSLFKLRGGVGILGSLGIVMGNMPRRVQGFPNIIKQFILLSSAITLFAGSTKLIDSVVKRIVRFTGSTRIVKQFSATFPVLANRIKALGREIPKVQTLGDRANRLGRPVHTIAKLALAFGSLLTAIRASTKVAKGVMILGAALTALSGAIFVIGGLANGLKELSGILGLLPGLGFVAATSIAALVVGVQHMDGAIKNLNSTQKEFNKAIAKLAPSAQEFAKALRGMRKRYGELRKAVQQRLFEGLGDEIKKVGTTYAPVLEKGLGRIASSLNGVVKEILSFLKQGQTISDFGKGFELVGEIIDNLKAGIKPLLNILRDVGMVGMEVMKDLTEGFGQSAKNAAKFVRTARRTGELRKWIEGGIQAVKDLWNILKNTFSIIDTFFDAFNRSGKPFLTTLAEATKRFDTFLKSAKGQEGLKELATTILTISGIVRNVFITAFKELAPILRELNPFLLDLSKAIGVTLTTAIKVAAPILRFIASTLSSMSPIIAPIIGTLFGLGLAAKGVGIAFVALKGVLATVYAGWKIFSSAVTIAKFVLIGITKTIIFLVKTLVVGLAKAVAAVAVALAKIAAGAAVFAARMAVSLAKGIAGLAVYTARLLAAAAVHAATWIRMAAVAVARAAVIAAAWLAANPIALIIAAVIAIVIFIIKNWDKIKAFLKKTWETIKSIAKTVFNAIKNFFVSIWNSIKNFFVGIWNSILSFVTGILSRIRNFFVSVWNSILGFARSVANNIKNAITNGVRNAYNAVRNWFDRAVAFVRSIPGRILSALGRLGSLLTGAGRSLIMGLWNGIKNAFNWVKDQVSGLLSGLRNMLPFSPAKEGPFSGKGYTTYSGKAMMEDFAKAIIAQKNTVNSAMDRVLSGASGRLAVSVGADVPGAVRGRGSMGAALAGKPATESVPAPINVGNLELHIAGNLDPTNPTAWRQAIVNIKEGIRSVERQYQ